MRELFLLLLLLGVIQAHSLANASDKNKKLDLTPPGQDSADTQDPGSATRLLYEDPRDTNSVMAGTGDKKNPANLKPTCTDNMGMVYKRGATGYDGCMRSFGGGTPPQLPGDTKKRSVGITIGQ